MNIRLAVVAIAALPLYSCVHSTYLQSPMHTNSNSYKAIPLHSEEVKSATYASGMLTSGSSNSSLRDLNLGFIGSVHRSHNIGNFQGFYGATGAVGNYHVDRDYFLGVYDSLFNRNGSNKFYSAWGFNGGINYVLPLRNGGEWRVFGTAVSWTREFGDYLSFRRKIPDSVVNAVDRHRDFTTLAFHSEFVFRIRKKGSLGYKFGYVTSLTSLRDEQTPYFNTTPGYFSQTLHFTRNHITGFWQTNFGYYAISSQLGVSYRF